VKELQCCLRWEKPSRNRKGCSGPLEMEGKYLLCEEHRLLVDRIVASANRKINAIRNARRFRKVA
jgi:hypothetical protein